MRRFLSYLPSHIGELPPRRETRRPARRARRELARDRPAESPPHLRHAPRLVSHVVDRDSLFEMTPLFGRSQITALARLDGRPVGVLANDPVHFGGAMTADGAQKVAASSACARPSTSPS